MNNVQNHLGLIHCIIKSSHLLLRVSLQACRLAVRSFLRFVNTSVLTLDITLDALLMTIIGGVGTLIGPILGAGVIELTQHYLSGLAKDYPIFERWIIFFGIIIF